MTIPTEIYSNLSAAERIRAAVSAQARNDEGEFRNLVETCPRKYYRTIDADFINGMEKIQTLSLAIEASFLEQALEFMIASKLEDHESVQSVLIAVASLATAWSTLLEELGIDRGEMANYGPPRHHAAAHLISISGGRAQAELVESHLAILRELVAA